MAQAGQDISTGVVLAYPTKPKAEQPMLPRSGTNLLIACIISGMSRRKRNRLLNTIGEVAAAGGDEESAMALRFLLAMERP